MSERDIFLNQIISFGRGCVSIAKRLSDSQEPYGSL